jgi:hypothetical protein
MAADKPKQILNKTATIKGIRQPFIRIKKQRLVSLIKIQITSKLPKLKKNPKKN